MLPTLPRRQRVDQYAGRSRLVGGCDQLASACEVHHLTHLADGGTTSADGCALYCFSTTMWPSTRWGWKVALSSLFIFQFPPGAGTDRPPPVGATMGEWSSRTV